MDILEEAVKDTTFFQFFGIKVSLSVARNIYASGYKERVQEFLDTRSPEIELRLNPPPSGYVETAALFRAWGFEQASLLIAGELFRLFPFKELGEGHDAHAIFAGDYATYGVPLRMIRQEALSIKKHPPRIKEWGNAKYHPQLWVEQETARMLVRRFEDLQIRVQLPIGEGNILWSPRQAAIRQLEKIHRIAGVDL